MQNNHQKSGYLGKRILISFFGSLIVSLILTALIAVPFVCLIPVLLAFPLLIMWPELETTGDLVEVGFAWLIVKQDWVWLVFFAYYFVVIFLALCILFFITNRLRLR